MARERESVCVGLSHAFDEQVLDAFFVEGSQQIGTVSGPRLRTFHFFEYSVGDIGGFMVLKNFPFGRGLRNA